MVRTAGAGAGAGACTVAGAGAAAVLGTATAGPESFRVCPGTMTEYGPRPLAASIVFTSTPNRAAMEPTVSPATTMYVVAAGALAGAAFLTTTGALTAVALAGAFAEAALTGAALAA